MTFFCPRARCFCLLIALSPTHTSLHQSTFPRSVFILTQNCHLSLYLHLFPGPGLQVIWAWELRTFLLLLTNSQEGISQGVVSSEHGRVSWWSGLVLVLRWIGTGGLISPPSRGQLEGTACASLTFPLIPHPSHP